MILYGNRYTTTIMMTDLKRLRGKHVLIYLSSSNTVIGETRIEMTSFYVLYT